jgi:multidrug efflux pump subunit AcrA (membrane-fusion protein)
MRENSTGGVLSLRERRQCTIGVVVLSAAMLVALGCNRSAAPSGQAKSETPSTTVGIVHPERKVLKRVVEQPGTIQADEETLLFARVPGYVRLFHDKDGRIIHDIGRRIQGPKYDPSGKEVEPGEVLAELVVPELEQQTNLKKAKVRQAEADVEQAEKAVAAAEANIGTMEAAVVEAKALKERWQSESNRFTSLTKSGTIDEQSRDEALNQFKASAARVVSTEAAVRKAKADRDKALADVLAMQARVDVAKADALEALAMLSYAKIRAPYDGVVTRRRVNTGNFVQPGGGQGDWLFEVARLDPVRVVVAVPEADAELVKEKAEAKITIQALSGLTLTGTVARTSWALEPGARTLRAEVDLPNKDGRLRPGMYVYAQIINPLPDGWTLPTSAVMKQGNATACFLIEGDKAVRMPVQVGRSDGQRVEVLKRQKAASPSAWEEFTGNETIAARAAGLTDGQAVQQEAAGK